MSESEPRRAFWKKKRWYAVGLLLLLIAYPLSVAPMIYCLGRGWISPSAVTSNTFYKPLFMAVDAASASEWSFEERPWWEEAAASTVTHYWDSMIWFGHLGERHRDAAAG